MILLLAGVLYHQGIDRVDGMFSTILDGLGKQPALENQARCVGLLGAAVRDLSPVGYQPRDERYAAALDQILAIFDAGKARGIDIVDAIAAAEALGQTGDPRFATPEARRANWVTIPAGEFLMGAQSQDPSKPNYDKEASGSGDKGPVHPVHLSAYRIGRYPVTVCEYGQFVQAGGYAEESHWSAGGFSRWKAPDEWEDQFQHPTRPVVGVDWFEAAAYASWADRTGLWPGCRLPTEAQWERAARGADGRRYPWPGGAAPSPTLLNYDKSRTGHPTPVGVYPGGATPEGVFDMAGNVWEWCADWYGEDYYANAEQQDPKGPDKGAARVLRGGSWVLGARRCRSACRDGYVPMCRGDDIGFRVVLVGRGLPE